MIDKIKLYAISENGDSLEIDESIIKLQSSLDVLVAATFSEIIYRQQNIEDDEIRASEKFHFAQSLANYLVEMKNEQTNS